MDENTSTDETGSKNDEASSAELIWPNPDTAENGATAGESNNADKPDSPAENSENEDPESANSMASDDVVMTVRRLKRYLNRRQSNDNDSSMTDSTGDQTSSNNTRHVREVNWDDIDSSPMNEGYSGTMLHDPDSESEAESEPAVLSKQKPSHNWFMVPEIMSRQIGYGLKRQNPELFQRRCYGSLHCVQRMELMYKLNKHDGCVNSLNFHPDGSLLASGSDDLKIVLWDWKLGNMLLSFDSKHRGNVFQSKFMHLTGDLHIATCSRDGQVRLAQVSKQEGLRSSRKLGCHRGACHKLSVLPDHPHIILSAGEDGVVLNHDVRNSKPTAICTVKVDELDVALYSIASHPLNSNEFCVCGKDNFVRTYDQRKCGSECLPLNMYFPKKVQKCNDYLGTHVTCALYNHDGTEILASYSDDDIYIFDINSSPGSFVHQYQGHRNGATIKGVNFFGPKSEYIISGSDCGNVYVWDKHTEAIVNWMLADDNGVVNCLEPHPQLPFLATSGLDWDIKVWVPSCEKDPVMGGLASTIKSNNSARKHWTSSGDLNETQMLWMLWRHLSSGSTRYTRTSSPIAPGYSAGQDSSGSSSTERDDISDIYPDSDEMDGPPGCTTS